MSLVPKPQLITEKSLDEHFADAQERWSRTSDIAANRIKDMDVEMGGIVYRTERSVAYKNEFPGANEVNDYFLVNYADQPERLPAHIKSLYGIDIEEVRE